MGSDCGESHHHKFHPSHQLYLNKKYLRDPPEIPPRKLLSRRPANLDPPSSDMESPTKAVEASDVNFQKYLPSGDDDDDDPYSADEFRMFEFKVRRCTRSRSHDWTDCPFAHPGEKARRRDPRKYHYSGTVCAEYRKGLCVKGENCEFAHGVFECWLHPTRYRTEACKDGKNCKRKVCFFAHTPRQLRILPPDCHDGGGGGGGTSPTNHLHHHHCCHYCHSPNSTLVGNFHSSPPVSPSIASPISPAKAPFSRFGCPDPIDHHLVSSFESLNINGVNSFSQNLINVDDSATTSASTTTATKFYNNDSGLPGIDLGWVNDLLT